MPVGKHIPKDTESRIRDAIRENWPSLSLWTIYQRFRYSVSYTTIVNVKDRMKKENKDGSNHSKG